MATLPDQNSDKLPETSGDVVALIRRAIMIVDQDGLAEPWRRILASAADVVILAAVDALALGLILTTSGGITDRQSVLFEIGVPIAAWLYVLIFWSLGQTLGMRLLGIRILSCDGKPMNPRRALIRCVGFVAACLPVRLGLAPILYHRRRQGWHDQLAGTVVVRVGSSFVPDITNGSAERTTKFQLNPPDFSACRPWWWIALPLYALASIAATYPLIRHLSNRIGGWSEDNSVFTWDYWFFRNAIQHHLSLTHSTNLFYPLNTSVLFNTMDWFNCVCAYPLLPKLGLYATYNVLLLFSLTATCFTSYILVCSLTKDRAASWIAGLAFGLSPFFTCQSLGHMNMITAQFVPLFALGVYGALITLKRRYAVLAGIAFALAVYSDLQYIPCLFIIVAGMFVGVIFEQTPIDWEKARTRAVLIAASCILGGLLSGPLLYPTLLEMHHSHYVSRQGQAGVFRADLTDYLMPSPLSPIGRRVFPARTLGSPDPDRVDSIGIVVIALSVFGLASYGRKLYPWMLTAATAFILSCGTVFTMNGSSPPAVLDIIAFGFPGNGFSMPWAMGSLHHLALNVLSQPLGALSCPEPLAMPFQWLPHLIPVAGALRAVVRLAMVVMLCCAVTAAHGLADLRRLIGARFGAIGRFGASLGILALLAGEYGACPYPTELKPISPFYSLLAKDREDYAVINVPLGPRENYSIFQAVHHKRVYATLLSRIPPTAFRYIDSNAFLSFAQYPTEKAPAEANMLAGLRDLRRLNTRYIFIQKWMFKPSDAARVESRLEGQYGLHPMYEDGYIRAYRL